MAGKSSTFANDILKLIFQATPIANIADNAASNPLTNLYLSLHTADPGPAAANGQATNEISYLTTGGVAAGRIALVRSATGWTVTGNSVSPTTQVQFAEKTGGTGGTATFVGVGTQSSGTGKLLYSGQLSPPIIVTQDGTIPTIKTSSTIQEL